MTNGATATDLTREECLQLLSTHAVGRLCVVEQGYPVAFPVNYRLVFESEKEPVVVLRVRDGGVLDVPGSLVAFQLDETNPLEETGWSVLARGILRDGLVEGAPPWLHYWNPRPWAGPRSQWLYFTIERISGRRLHIDHADAPPSAGYL